MTRKPTARTDIVAILFGVVLAACAAKSAPRATAPQEMPTTRVDAGVPNDDIDSLDQQIAADMAAIGAELPTDRDITEAMVSHSTPALPMTSDIASTCDEPPSTDRCSDVCNYADAICHNAGRICELADDLGDPHSAQRCATGKLSCSRAEERCCGCE